MTTLARRLTLTAGACAALAAAGCGSSASPTPSVTVTAAATASATPSAPAGSLPSASPAAQGSIATPIADATATRDRLLALAPVGTKLDTSSDSPVVAWKGTGLVFNGSAVTASATTVSGFAFVYSKAKSVNYLAIAVADSSSHCAGAVLENADNNPPTITKVTPVDVPSGVACQGGAVAQQAGF